MKRIQVFRTNKTDSVGTLFRPWNSVLTLQEMMLPNTENVSNKALSSMLLSKFLMKTLPTTAFFKRWITLGPHYPHRATIDGVKVHGYQCSFG